MELIYWENDYSFYRFKPSLYKLFEINMEQLTLRKRIRFSLALINGYEVIYMKHFDEFIGYCVVTRGGAGRYSFTSVNDIVIGPYFIKPSYRGQGLSTFLLNKVLNNFYSNYHYAFDYIEKYNTPSIKVTERVGFEYYSKAHISRFKRKIIPNDSKESLFIIYRFLNKDYITENN